MIIGHHIGKKDLLDDIRKQVKLPFNAYQIFASSPKSWAVSSNALDINKEVLMLRELCYTHNVFLVIHGKYLYNFCRDSSIQTEVLIKELQYAAKISSDVGIIIHQGKNTLGLSRDEAVQQFCDNIVHILEETRDLQNKIILENSAHQGTEIGYSLEELAIIYNKINSPRIGICIDLCHIFVAGELDMREGVAVKSFFKRFNKLIGIENLTVIHYNDSNAKFDSHNDCHGDICAGYIGQPRLGGTSEGFSVVAKIAKKHKIPMILETPACSSSYNNQILGIMGLFP